MEYPTCACKLVFLLFSCGHEFTKIHSCGASQTFQNLTALPRDEIVFRVHEKCMECQWAMTNGGGFEGKENAVDYLGEPGTPDRCGELLGFYEEEDGRLGYNFGYDREDEYEDHTVNEIGPENQLRSYRDMFEQTREAIVDQAERTSERDTTTPQLPYSEHGSHVPEIVSSDDHSLNIAIDSYPGEENEISQNARHSTELVTEWLRAEITDIPDTTHMHQKDRVLLFPVGPVQNFDDPYDTSASSCGRTSDGTMKQYIPGASREAANIDQTRQKEARTTTSESVQSLNEHVVHRTRHRSQPRPYTWPHSQPILITTPRPLTYRPITPPAPKRSLTAKFRTTILNSCDTVFNKLFTKKGIDGRTLQRRSLTITAESRMLGRLSRKGSRAERKADELRRKMLRKTYGTPGFFEVVASDSCDFFVESENETIGASCWRRGRFGIVGR